MWHGCVMSMSTRKIVAKAAHKEKLWCLNMLHSEEFLPEDDRYYILGSSRIEYEFEKLKGNLKFLLGKGD